MSAFLARSFTYDDVFGEDYGLYIAYEDKSAQEVDAFKSSIKTIKASHSNDLIFTNYDSIDNTQIELTLLSVEPIDSVQFGNISKWLLGRSEFKKLIIHQPDLEDVYFNCVFTECVKKHITGYANMLILTGICDSPYQRAITPDVYTVTLGSSVNTEEILINNDSDVEDYIYPEVTITANATSNITIKNISDNNRQTVIQNMTSGEVIKMDNKNQIISTTKTPSDIFNRFNMKWFRLKDGDNLLQITGASTVEIKLIILRRVGA